MGQSVFDKNPKEMSEKELEFVLTGLEKRKAKIEKQYDRVKAELEKRVNERLNRELNEKRIEEKRKKRGY